MGKLVKTNEKGYRIGESHPNARYPDSVVDAVVELHEAGWGYKRIAQKMEIPKRTVRDFCSAKRRNQTTDRVRVVEEVS